MRKVICILSLFVFFAAQFGCAQNNPADVHKNLKNDQEKNTPAVKVIKLEAFQYGFSPDPVIVKKGERVRLEITSRDVTHGVYIEEYGIKETVSKGEKKEVEFTAEKPGTFEIICSVYCGPGHSGMKGKLVVQDDQTP
ncbi:MAG: cupredoxin domain-containing protein [Candidatus Omnitrophica bacterium]|nr:cupredoxin domain-containing protein [Candidatus Omnitrophota bacterium]